MSDDDIGSLAWVARMEAQAAAARVATDDESKPMTRTELAMLWDLLGMWDALHPFGDAGPLRDEVDAELTERYGG